LLHAATDLAYGRLSTLITAERLFRLVVLTRNTYREQGLIRPVYIPSILKALPRLHWPLLVGLFLFLCAVHHPVLPQIGRFIPCRFCLTIGHIACHILEDVAGYIERTNPILFDYRCLHPLFKYNPYVRNN